MSAKSRSGSLSPRNSMLFQLFRASHPRLALLTAVAVTAVAGVSGRPAREVGLVFATVLVGQVILGWFNDLVDRDRDKEHDREDKPLATDRLDAGTVGFAIACAVLLVVPLSIANGIVAGSTHLSLLAIALLGNLPLFRRTALSPLPWAASYALFPAFLSYGGWGGDALGNPPEILVTVAAGALGIGVHFLSALSGLVADNKDGFRHLPLRVALKTGAPRLLLLSGLFTALAAGGVVAAGLAVGLAQ